MKITNQQLRKLIREIFEVYLPWDEIDPLLGTMIDRKLANLYKTTTETIFDRRKKKGIPPFVKKANKIHWDDIDHLINVESDKDISDMFGISLSSITNRRKYITDARGKKPGIIPDLFWERNIDNLLGKHSDLTVARAFGTSQQRVANRRKELGISLIRLKVPWDDIIPLLGTKNDNDIAQEFGVSPVSVFKKRKKLGISAYRQKRYKI